MATSHDDISSSLIYYFWFPVAFIVWTNDWTPFHSKATAYSVFCTGDRNGSVCNGIELTGARTSYRADRELQSVTYWREDNRPAKYNDCAIIDSENWSCQLKDPQRIPITLEMIDGIFQPHHSTDPMLAIALTGGAYSVSKWHWWRIRMSELSTQLTSWLKK